jgi:hypothetical protein
MPKMVTGYAKCGGNTPGTGCASTMRPPPGVSPLTVHGLTRPPGNSCDRLSGVYKLSGWLTGPSPGGRMREQGCQWGWG